MQPELQMDVFF